MTDPIVTTLKICSKCGEEKTVSEFYRTKSKKDGFYPHCKPCHDLHTETLIRARLEKFRASPNDPNAPKKCNRCHKTKPLHEFNKNRRNVDGYAYLCRHCHRNRSKKLYRAIKKEWSDKPIDRHGTKICGHCDNEKPKTEFSRSIGRRTGLSPWCKKCTIEKGRNERYKALLHYSNGELPSCQCCEEKRIEFLSIDHINGGGGQERKRLGMGGSQFCAYLRIHGYPEGYQTLCHNCNLAKGYYGHCPHTCTHADH